MKLIEVLSRIASFVYPIRYKTVYSEFSGNLELTWYNGKLLLDTENTNYSYGNLQRVLDKAINKINSEIILNAKNILLLGVAGGSVIESLYTKYQFKNKIDAVDIDPVILKIAEEEYKINRFKNCSFFATDAKLYVEKCTKKYNIIIIDLFIDYQIPDFVFDKCFIDNIKRLLEDKGVILFNTISLEKKQNQNSNLFTEKFNKDYNVKVLKNIEQYNSIYIIQKK
nr:methyltransferase domain-containing protein [uncultured Flavobacterium sp.]